MLRAVGCLFPESLQKYTSIEYRPIGGLWFKAGASILEEGGLDCMGVLLLVHAQSIFAVSKGELVVRCRVTVIYCHAGCVPDFYH